MRLGSKLGRGLLQWGPGGECKWKSALMVNSIATCAVCGQPVTAAPLWPHLAFCGRCTLLLAWSDEDTARLRERLPGVGLLFDYTEELPRVAALAERVLGPLMGTGVYV